MNGNSFLMNKRPFEVISYNTLLYVRHIEDIHPHESHYSIWFRKD